MESHTESHTKAIHFAIHKTGVAIRKAVQDGSIAIQCHTKSCTVQQQSHTVYIQKAIQYSKTAIHEQK